VRSQIKLGKIFGIEIGLHYSWFLIALLIVQIFVVYRCGVEPKKKRLEEIEP